MFLGMTVLGAVRCKRQRHLSVTGACAQSHLHCMQIYKEFSSGFSWVPLYSLIVAEEELMNVAESPLKTGEETGEKRGDETGDERRSKIRGINMSSVS